MKRLGLTRFWLGFLVVAAVGAAIAIGAPKPRKQTKEVELKASGPARLTGASPARKVRDNGDDVKSASVQPGGGNGEDGEPYQPVIGAPREWRMVKAHSFDGDLRRLPLVTLSKTEKAEEFERPEREQPDLHPVPVGGTVDTEGREAVEAPQVVNAPVPTPTQNFDGMNFTGIGGQGHPPDTNGDVGPNYYVQTINVGLAIYNKNGTVAAGPFSYNTFMSQGAFGNLCDTNNFGDPVVLYDTFEDRWVVTDFAFQLNSGAVVNPPGAFQCFAVSKTGDPILGGWNFFSLHLTDFLNDYPKFGIWPDGIYMTSNLFGFPAGGSFAGVRVWALNKQQMYTGSPTVQVVTFDVGGGDFTIIPSNARLQTGTPPPGTPNYYITTSTFTNALPIYKFHVDWNSISLSTFTGPTIIATGSSFNSSSPASAPSLGGNNLDVIPLRAMMQNQYTNLAGAESIWVPHTVRRAAGGFATPRFYQVNVTGGSLATVQAATFDPDGANVIHRFVPSLGVDRAGDMAMGYSTSSSTTKPAIKYAGRLSTDPVNTFPQTEQLLVQGTGTQVGNCGTSACIRWGDYSAMTLDPDGCTFWYTTEYYQADGLDHHTRIGSFKYNECTPVGNGSISGTVTGVPGGPLSGATVTLGVRTTTTNGSGAYSFTGIPAGTYPIMTASFPGYTTGTATSVVVNDGANTVQDFALNAAPQSACLTDTSQNDFLSGVGTNVDVNSSPGNVMLTSPSNLDQQNTSLSTSGNGISTTAWSGQTFVPAVTGKLVRADVNLFCFGCTGTAPVVTVSVRATSGGLPTGPDLAAATFTTSTSGASAYFSANFTTPPTLTSGTTYALAIRDAVDPSAGGINAVTRSAANAYANGARVTSADGGVTWVAQVTDIGFRTFMNAGFSPSGNLVSSLKDANPSNVNYPTWTTLSWNATVPANTSVMFQAAGSNSAAGPFNFVGPDGTAATFYTSSPGSLSQFNGLRYLKYKAYLATTDSTVTPTLSDVTVCFVDRGILRALSPAKLWVGLANSDDVGIKFDVHVIIRKNGVSVGTGDLASAVGGSSGFNNAQFDTVNLNLAGPVPVFANDPLSIEVQVRNACVGSGKNSGRARLWYNGAMIDSGATRDAGSRFDATIGDTTSNYFLRTGSALNTTAGAARTTVDAQAGPKCGPFVSLGTWSVNLP